MTENEGPDSIRSRLTRQCEEALGKMAEELLQNPLVTGALSRAFEAREKAVQAQEVAMGALNLPSATDLERLTRRLRAVSQRLEGIEDGVERLDDRLASVSRQSSADERLKRIEEQLESLTGELTNLRKALPADEPPVARNQERLKVGDSG